MMRVCLIVGSAGFLMLLAVFLSALFVFGPDDDLPPGRGCSPPPGWRVIDGAGPEYPHR
jgi:hypothetical protein